MPQKITFYQIKDNAAKIQLICAKAHEAFQHEKRLLITVPNLQAAQYVDALLWRIPEESFIPHVITDFSTPEWIAITLQDKQNVNQATCLLNLCTELPALYQQMEEIYEIYDETHPQKVACSKQRLDQYQAYGLVIKREGDF